MDFPSNKWVREQPDSTGPQESSPAAPSAEAATFERQLSEIANSGGGGGAMPAAAALQPAQSTGVLIGRQSKQPLYSEDARLISGGLKKALIDRNANERTAAEYEGSLLSFGRWLFANNKDPIAARLDDKSLTDDAREYRKRRPGKLLTALYHLRTFQSTGGVVQIAGRVELNPHPQDAALIKEYKNEAVSGSTASNYAVALRSFSDYLRENYKEGIAGRLSGNALDGDVESYRKDAGADSRIGAALAHLRKSQAGAKAMERERHIPPVPAPEDAALTESRRVGAAAAQHSASQGAGSWPEELLPAEGYDQDLGRMDEPGPSSSAPQPAQSTRVLMGRNKPLYSQDAPLISGLEKGLIKGTGAERTAKDYVYSLRGFGRWLFANHKKGIVARLDNESLTDDAREFAGNGKPGLLLSPSYSSECA